MGEKKHFKAYISPITIFIIFISVVPGVIIFNQDKSFEKDDVNYRNEVFPEISQKPDYVVYPAIPNITITHEDNISLYASSGDGLSWETAFIIDNFTVYHSEKNSINLRNIDKYLIIRNFEIKPNSTWTYIALYACSNIRFENGKLYQTVAAKESWTNGFYIQASSNITITNIHYYTAIPNEFVNSNNIVFSDITYSSEFNRKYIFLMNGCSDVLFSNIIFLNNNYKELTFWGTYTYNYAGWMYDCSNVTFYNVDWKDNGLDIERSNLITLEKNTFTQARDLDFSNCYGVQLINNTIEFQGKSNIYLDAEGTTLIENNTFIGGEQDGLEKIILIRFLSGYKVIIRNNNFICETPVFYFRRCNTVEILYNYISCNAAHVIHTFGDPTNFADDLTIKHNTFEGKFNQIIENESNIKYFFMIFTNKLPHRPLLLINLIIITLLLGFGISSFYFQKIEQGTQHKRKETQSEITKQSSYGGVFRGMLASSIIGFMLTSLLISPPSIFFTFTYDPYNQVTWSLLPQIVIFMIIWSVIILINIIVIWKQKKQVFTQKLTDIRNWKIKLVKIILPLSLSLILLYYPFHFLCYVFSFQTTKVYVAILFIVIFFVYSPELRNIKFKSSTLISFSIIVTLDLILYGILNTIIEINRESTLNLISIISVIIRIIYCCAFLMRFSYDKTVDIVKTLPYAD